MSVTEKEISQYLNFTLGKESFAIAVENIREVLDSAAITALPQTPDYVLGVINLRGSVVPVIDLRLKFGLNKAELTRESCIVVMEVRMDDELLVVGALVDAVQEVLDVAAGEIEPPPRLGTKLRTDFIRGMGKHNDQFMIILDIHKIFTTDEILKVSDAVEEIQQEVQQAV